MRNALAATALLLIGSAGGRAMADDGIDCNNAMNQHDMNLCASQSYDRADARLNRVYRNLVAHLDGRESDQLRDAERSWISYRDRECRYSARENEGGSIYPMVWFGCLTEQTEKRTKDLQAHLGCLDNGRNDCAE